LGTAFGGQNKVGTGENELMGHPVKDLKKYVKNHWAENEHWASQNKVGDLFWWGRGAFCAPFNALPWEKVLATCLRVT